MVDQTPSAGDDPTAASDPSRTREGETPSETKTGDTALGDVIRASGGGEPVELSTLTKRYGEETAVDNISLDVSEGELLVLLGPSGCGKTTTLRMVAGLESVTSGSVSIGNTDVSITAPQERDVAMVFQNYALYPHKSVRGNIRFPLRKTDLSTAEQRERIEATAELLDITGLLEKEPAALSGGQRQRVAIGRAIAREPSVLLMDEPLSNLDAKLRVRTRSELKSLQQRLGITMLYVTHDQEEAMSIADRIAIMNDGHIEQVGTPEEVYQDPDSTFIASFLGDPPMNILTLDTGSTTRGGSSTLRAGLERVAPDSASTVGIRPEDLYLVADGDVVGDDAPASVSDPYECAVVVTEPIGRAYELTLTPDTGRSTDAAHTGESNHLIVRARTLSEDLRGRDRVSVAFDPESVYAFDDDGGRIR